MRWRQIFTAIRLAVLDEDGRRNRREFKHLGSRVKMHKSSKQSRRHPISEKVPDREKLGYRERGNMTRKVPLSSVALASTGSISKGSSTIRITFLSLRDVSAR